LQPPRRISLVNRHANNHRAVDEGSNRSRPTQMQRVWDGRMRKPGGARRALQPRGDAAHSSIGEHPKEGLRPTWPTSRRMVAFGRGVTLLPLVQQVECLNGGEPGDIELGQSLAP